MQPAINTVCMPELTWSEALAACKTAGFTRVEFLAVPGWAHIDPAKQSAAELTAAATRIGVQLVGIHAGGINGESDAALDDSTAYIRQVMELAGQLGATRVVFSGFPWPADLTPDIRAAILARIARRLAALAPRAEALGLNICLENHSHCQMETLADYEAVFAQVDHPRVGATVDTGHFTASGVDPVSVVQGLGARVLNVHMKDHIGTESVGLGYGATNNLGVVRALRALGYPHDLTVELEVHDRANALRFVREAFPYLHNIISVE